MKKHTILLDPGHGGLIDGKYITPGKRSPKFEDGSVLYEGVNNRDNVNRLIKALKAEGYDVIDIVNSNQDISLVERVKRANELSKTKSCIYISMHSDGAGDGINWHAASGMSVWTSPGQTKSDIIAQEVIDSLQLEFGNSVKWRVDKTDGDEDTEAHFYVIEKTSCPAILIEGGFHTNKEETKRIQTEEWKNKLVKSIVQALNNYELKNS